MASECCIWKIDDNQLASAMAELSISAIELHARRYSSPRRRLPPVVRYTDTGGPVGDRVLADVVETESRVAGWPLVDVLYIAALSTNSITV